MSLKNFTKLLVLLLFFGILFSGCAKKAEEELARTEEQVKMQFEPTFTADEVKQEIEKKYMEFVKAMNTGDIEALSAYIDSTVTKDAAFTEKGKTDIMDKEGILQYWKDLIESGITDFQMEIIMVQVVYKIHQEIPGGHYYDHFARVIGTYSYKLKGEEVVKDPPYDECWLHMDTCPWWNSCGDY